MYIRLALPGRKGQTCSLRLTFTIHLQFRPVQYCVKPLRKVSVSIPPIFYTTHSSAPACYTKTAYIEVTVGIEADGSAIVIVLHRGHNRESLEQEPVQRDDEMLAQMAKKILLTPGVWLCLWP